MIAEITEQLVQETIHANPSRTICIAVDESPDSEYCVNWAIEKLIQPEFDQVILLNCRPDPENDADYAFYYANPFLDVEALMKKIDSNNKIRSHTLLRKFGKLFHHREIFARAIALKGETRKEIVAKTEQLKPDMLILASRGLGAIKRRLLGSVSDYCVHHVKCPVLITRLKKDK